MTSMQATGPNGIDGGTAGRLLHRRGWHRVPRHAWCLRCVFNFFRINQAAAERWKARFEQVSGLRTAIHFGHVVTAKIQLGWRKSADFVDAFNTTRQWRDWRRNSVRVSRSPAIYLVA